MLGEIWHSKVPRMIKILSHKNWSFLRIKNVHYQVELATLNNKMKGWMMLVFLSHSITSKGLRERIEINGNSSELFHLPIISVTNSE